MGKNERKSRAAEIDRILDESSMATIRFLNSRDPFQFLISVILSAQTTDRQVNEVAVTLFSRYPDARALAHAESTDVKTIIRSTGFFNMKAKNIIACAQKLVSEFAGEVPQTMEALLTLPGVGRKTANCVLGDVFGKPAIIVDTHFSRVVQRLMLVDTSNPEEIELEIGKLISPSHQYRFSMTVNLHGRQTCHARKPVCASCTIRALCPTAGSW